MRYSARILRTNDSAVKQYCRFHPVNTALASCAACGSQFCSSCLEATAARAEGPNCPQCKKNLAAIDPSRSRAAAPQLRNSMVAPLRTPLRLGLLCAALIAGAVFAASDGLSLWHEAIALVCTTLSAGWALSFASPSDRAKAAHRTTLMLLATLVVLLPWLLFQVGGAWVAFFAALLMSPVLSIGLIAGLQGRAQSNQQIWRELPTTLGALKALSSYLFLSAMMLLVAWSLLWDARALLPASSFSLPLLVLVLSFSLLVYGHWCRSCLVYHGLQDGAARAEQKPAIKAPTFDAVRAASAHIDMALTEGKYESARDLLEEEIKRGHRQLRAEALYLLLQYMRDEEGLRRHSHLFLRWMLYQKHAEKALAFLAQLRQSEKTFRIHDADLNLQLARACREHKQHRQLLWLANEAHIRFDGEAEVADLYLLAAKTLLEAFSERTKAQSYLKHILSRHAESEAAKQASILMKLLDGQAAKRGLG